MSIDQSGSPADRVSTAVDGVEVLGALSPSRAGDFMACPLLYRFRTIDRLPEPSSPDAVRGSLVHKVLEDLYDLPAVDRTPDQARSLLVPTWQALLADEPEIAEMFVPAGEEGTDVDSWLVTCREVLDRYFTLEDPRQLEPAERELYVETLLDSRLLLRGFVDRLDIAPDGRIRVVDYKSGRSPTERYEAKALFQMKFYALVIWRTRGVIPAMLQLIYLGNSEIMRYVPDEQDLLATERKVEAIWHA
ncbi:MAG TPA: PD-(D/E)XK nuclease family protein, partial [Nocardioides sp.]|nr:PD-(D/E)XK nuclease family protein [Nocardioides sp.]